MIFPALATEDNDFRATCLAYNSGTDSRTVNSRCANGHFITIAKHDDVIQNDFSAFFCGDALNQDGIILRYTILFATCFHQSIHGDLPYHNNVTPSHRQPSALSARSYRQRHSSFTTVASDRDTTCFGRTNPRPTSGKNAIMRRTIRFAGDVSSVCLCYRMVK